EVIEGDAVLVAIGCQRFAPGHARLAHPAARELLAHLVPWPGIADAALAVVAAGAEIQGFHAAHAILSVVDFRRLLRSVGMLHGALPFSRSYPCDRSPAGRFNAPAGWS